MKLVIEVDGQPEEWTLPLADDGWPKRHPRHDYPLKWLIDYVITLLHEKNCLSAHIWPIHKELEPLLEREGEKRSFWQLMADLDDVTIAARIETREKMRSLIGLCGLTQAEAAAVLGISHDTLRQRMTGYRVSPNPDGEIATLVRVWKRVEANDVADLPEGAKRQAAILAFARQARLD